MSPPLGAPGNLIIIEDDDEELNRQSDDEELNRQSDDEELNRQSDNFYIAELTFSMPVSFLLHCQECTSR